MMELIQNPDTRILALILLSIYILGALQIILLGIVLLKIAFHALRVNKSKRQLVASIEKLMEKAHINPNEVPEHTKYETVERIIDSYLYGEQAKQLARAYDEIEIIKKTMARFNKENGSK